MQILVMYNSLKPFQGAKGNIDREAHFPTSLSQQLLIIIVGNNFWYPIIVFKMDQVYYFILFHCDFNFQ